MSENPQSKILHDLTEQAESSAPGTRLPTVRQLMQDYGVSQVIVERALDELTRLGLVRRERSRGIFVDGYVPTTRMLGVCCNDQTTSRTTQLFRDGVRDEAATRDFQVADFGSKSIVEICQALVEPVAEMGFAGLVLDLSTSAAMHLEADDALASRLRDMAMPLVVTRPLPAIQADCVSADDFETFRRIGERLCDEGSGPVQFLGHQGLPTLARFYGLEAGIAGRRELRLRIADRHAGGAMACIPALRDGDTALVVGAPPNAGRELQALVDGPWRAGSDRGLVVTLEEGDIIPPGLHAHIVTKPTRQLGAAAAELLIRRLHRPRAVRRHKVVAFDIAWNTN